MAVNVNLAKVVEKRTKTAKKRKATLAYHRQYNEDHAEHLSDIKASKYKTDPAYQAAAKKRSREAYAKKKLEAEKIRASVTLNPQKALRSGNHTYCPLCHQPLPKPPKPIFKSVAKKYLVAMFTIVEIARRLGKQTKTVNIWQANGVIPESMYKERRGKAVTMTRLWTQDQVEMFMRVFDHYDLRPPISFKKCGLVDELRQEWDKLRPYGIDVKLYTDHVEEHKLWARESPDLPLPSHSQKREKRHGSQKETAEGASGAR